MGVPIFLMAQYGQQHPTEVFSFFAEIAASPDWIVREFAAGGFHSVIASNKDAVLPWLKETALSKNPNVRRFVSETLRPVTVNRWMKKEPEYSLSVLRLLFREAHPYPRTSVGNNLSDLSSRQPELIFSIVQELVASRDPNSYWIAYRACRNLVKKYPRHVMDILGVDEYHYKDRNFYRSNLIAE
jgi:3-methyladenine DNA glycosylase AlkC